jgi:hypothetical protein
MSDENEGDKQTSKLPKEILSTIIKTDEALQKLPNDDLQDLAKIIANFSAVGGKLILDENENKDEPKKSK